MRQYMEVQYKKKRILKAGSGISNFDSASEEYQSCLPVVDNWRAAHAYPLDVVYTLISGLFYDEENISVVQRLKRLDSIIGKLKRENNTNLYGMQDLGGCRVIVPEVDNVYPAVEIIKKCILENGHEIKNEKDYLLEPRIQSGYRSYHIVVMFHDNKNSCYDGMLVEIQVRSKLQHTWATAVEIMDCITGESLKAGAGNVEYMEFFKLVSALFSIEEGTAIVEGVPNEEGNIVKKLRSIDNKEHIREKLSAYKSAIKLTGGYTNNADYYLLITDIRKKTISAKEFCKAELQKATEAYNAIEQTKNNNGLDVVLVAAKNFDTIRTCYPNYFMETATFLGRISRLCSSYPERMEANIITLQKSVMISDYFHGRLFEEHNIVISEGIGLPQGDLVICPDYPCSLDESYLRFSGIVYDSKLLPQKVKPHLINGPAIIVLRTGACFYVDKEEQWSFVSGVSSYVIQCNKGTDKKHLLFLISWLKSNVCTWNLVMNIHSNSVNPDVFNFFLMPKPKGQLYEDICKYSEKVLTMEKSFVEIYCNHDQNDIEMLQVLADRFNGEVLDVLKRIEYEFIDYYQLDDNDIAQMGQELELNGYFSYLK